MPNPGVVTVEEMVRRAYGDAPKEVLLAGIGGLDTYLQTSQRIDRRWGTQSPNMVEFFANRQHLNVVFTSREFHLAGDSYDATYRFTGPAIPGPDCCAESASGEAPLVYISLGTIFNDRPDFYRACFEALGEEPCRVAVGHGDKGGSRRPRACARQFHALPNVPTNSLSSGRPPCLSRMAE